MESTNIERAPRLVKLLEAAQQATMASLIGSTESELHTAPANGEWTVAEVCAHVIEMQTLWLQKIANVAQDSDLERSVAEIDRRTAEVAAHATDDFETIQRRLGKLTPKPSAYLTVFQSPHSTRRPTGGQPRRLSSL